MDLNQYWKIVEKLPNGTYQQCKKQLPYAAVKILTTLELVAVLKIRFPETQ